MSSSPGLRHSDDRELLPDQDDRYTGSPRRKIPTGARSPYFAGGLFPPPVAPINTPPLDKAESKGAVAFNRVCIQTIDEVNEEQTKFATGIVAALGLRKKFQWDPPLDRSWREVRQTPDWSPPSDEVLPKTQHGYKFVDGVMVAWAGESEDKASAKFSAPSYQEFSEALHSIMELVSNGPAKTFAHSRMHILEARYNMHDLLNHALETRAQKAVPHRDFYNVRKIDNHVHHSACMNQKHLLRFIKSKLKKESDAKVIIRSGQVLTLSQVFESLGLTPYDLSVDTLDMHADGTFHRFDKFNLKYNPIGESRLREIFLKYNNYNKGLYLAEVTQQVFDDLEANKYQYAEYRLSIYGRQRNEWDVLAEWVVDNKLNSEKVRWMIQIPRLYEVYKRAKEINSFQDMLDNIFLPLFEVTVDPQSHPKLHVFLKTVVGFDSVDDESLRETLYSSNPVTPAKWDMEYSPSYAFFSFYVYANLQVLNKLRAAKGMTTFAYRPHGGEAGDVEHLAACYLLARSINHGLVLQHNPVLQYLYYLRQIGISMSPLSNNLLFVEYKKNPFPRFFARGLNVTLSTDDPLMIHVTKEPLVEEYSVAAQVWKLKAVDMCEIARNSVLQSGFEHRFKVHWVGNSYWLRSTEGNDLRQTNVPDIRMQFRYELLAGEYQLLSAYSKQRVDLDVYTDTIY